MSIRVATATILAMRSIADGSILQLRRSARKTKRTVAVAVLAAAALAANIADAAALNQHRHSRASAARSNWVGYYAPSNYGRYDHGASERSRIKLDAGHGAFEEHPGAP